MKPINESQDRKAEDPVLTFAPKKRERIRWECLFDILVSAVAIVAAAPVLLVAIIVVKAVSRGPAIYKQERIGFNGKPFMLYKLRTMRVASDAGTHHNYTLSLIRDDQPLAKLDAKGDNRLIPFGRFLRASGIDELPQLVNILRREMSLSGPRPCLPGEFVAFSPNQSKRFDTLPGLTGLWQVSGKNKLTFKQMVALDLEYVENKSLWLYLKVLAKTPGVLAQQILEANQPANLTPINRELASKAKKEIASSNISLEHA